MTNPDKTALLLVIDRSGSMTSIRNDMNGGLNSFLKEQSELPGELTVNICYFDNRYEHDVKLQPVVASALPVVDIQPRGSTALYDAIVRAVGELGQSLADMDEDDRPGRVTVVVATDGYENSSQENRAEDVKKVIEEQTNKYGWHFVFLGANQDAITTGTTLGFNKDYSLTYAASSAGVHNTANSLHSHMTVYRSAPAAAAASVAGFTDDDRDAAIEG